MHVLTLCGRICIGLSLRALLAALWNKAGHYILPCGFCLCVFLSSSSFFLAYSQRSEIGCLPYFYTSTHGVALMRI